MHVSNKTMLLLATFSFLSVTFANPIATIHNKFPATDDELSPPSIKPSALKSSLTIITDADVTWCRPFPNTALRPKQGTTYGRGTSLKLTCWTYNDIPGTEAGESDPWDIWVKTGSYGCFINENDLRSWNIDFEETLSYCAHPGPYKLAGNRPIGLNDPSLSLPPFAPLPKALPAPSDLSIPLPSPLPPVVPTPVTPTIAIPPSPKAEAQLLPTVVPVANASQLLPSPKAAAPVPAKPDNSTKIGARRHLGTSRRLF